MARFFFDLLGRRGAVKDTEGVERSDLTSAIDTAIESARDVIAGEVLNGSVDLDQRIVILDARRAVVASIRFSDAVSIVGWSAPE